jgi:hypothetical protein
VATARTDGRGDWSATLDGNHAFGDDRDAIVIGYGRGGPKPDLIATGSGGNPFTQSGWTGWFDLDNGYAVADHGVLLGPCSQTGVLVLTVGRLEAPSPVEQCETETDVAAVHTARIRPGTPLTMTSEDDRAVSPLNADGALVRLTVPLGEPDSASALGNGQLLFEPTGFPTCTANLEAQSVVCDGLTPGAKYRLTRRRHHVVRYARADFGGEARIAHAGVTGGDVITLTNSARRTLTTLHVAHLRVHVVGQQTVLAGGTCQPGDYYGKPITSPPIGALVGIGGATATGIDCPPDGRARGLPSTNIEQTDDFSGGMTRTELVGEASLSPNNGATLYGSFVAAAEPALFGPNQSVIPARGTVSLTVRPLHSKRRVLFLRNVATGTGVTVDGLARGVYSATWVVTNVNGDTVTVQTRFVEAA